MKKILTMMAIIMALGTAAIAYDICPDGSYSTHGCQVLPDGSYL